METGTDFKIYFSKVLPDRTTKTGLVFFLSPAANVWDDFGKKVCFDLTIFNNGSKLSTESRFTKIIPESLQAEISQSIAPTPIRNIQTPFLSQVIGLDSYNELAKKFGLNVTVDFLVKIKDAATLKLLNPKNESLSLFTQENEEAFLEALIREDSSYSLYNGCLSLFDFVLNTIPTKETYKFKLAELENAHNLRISFNKNTFFQSRIFGLIGKNGVGKSQALKNIAKIEAEKIFDSDPNSQLNYNRIVVFSNVLNDAFPESHELINHGGLFYQYINLIQDDNGQSLTKTLFSLARLGRERIETLKGALKGIIEFDDIWLPLKQGDYVFDFDYKMREGGKFLSISSYARFQEQKKLAAAAYIDVGQEPLFIVDPWDDGEKKLSTGQLSFVSLVCKFVAHISQRTLVLIDEPEAYLHPNLMVDLFKVLDKTLQSTDSFCVFSTHSVYLVRELMSDQVRVFQIVDQKVQIVKPVIQTFGGSLDVISDYIFGDLDHGKQFQDILDAADEENLSEGRTLLGDEALLYVMNQSPVADDEED